MSISFNSVLLANGERMDDARGSKCVVQSFRQDQRYRTSVERGRKKEEGRKICGAYLVRFVRSDHLELNKLRNKRRERGRNHRCQFSARSDCSYHSYWPRRNERQRGDLEESPWSLAIPNRTKRTARSAISSLTWLVVIDRV